MFPSPDSSESIDLSLIREVSLTMVGMPSPLDMLVALRFLPLWSMEHRSQQQQQQKSPSTFTKPKMQQHAASILTVYSACSQSDYSRVLY